MVSDDTVPELSQKACAYDDLCLDVPGFTKAQLITSDLLSKTQWALKRDLNRNLTAEGLATVYRVSMATRSLDNTFLSEDERSRTRAALVATFRQVSGCNYEAACAAIVQWAVIEDWLEERVSFAHPLSKFDNRDNYRDLRTEIKEDIEFASVREAADILAAAGIQYVKFPKSTKTPKS